MDTVVHECDRQTDGQTDRWTDRITIPKTVQRRASHGKNRRKQFCIFVKRTEGQKWLDSIEKQKIRSNLCDRQTDGQTDRVNDKKIIDS